MYIRPIPKHTNIFITVDLNPVGQNNDQLLNVKPIKAQYL